MGKRSWLDKDLHDRWLPALAQLRNTAAGHRKAEKLCAEMRSGWAERGAKKLNQQQSLMDQVRVAIKQQLGADHFSLDWIKFSTAEYVELNNAKQDSTAARNEAIQFIDNPDLIVGKAVELLGSPEWSDICAGLAVLTGRRSSELLSTARFAKASQWSVSFTGALKRRGEVQELCFEIPTLTTADRVLKALAKVRSELPDATELSAEVVNRKYGQAVIRACDKHFTGLVPLREGKDNLYTHLFRAVYATIATFWYCPPTVNDTEFKAAIQGHFAILDEANPQLRRKLAASRHYADYEIADRVIAQHQGKRKGIKLGHGGVKPLTMFAQAETTPQAVAPRVKKRIAGVRVWQEDKALLQELFERLGFDQEGTQPERMSHLLHWAKEQLRTTPVVDTNDREQTAATEKPAEVETTPSSEVELTPTDTTTSQPADVGLLSVASQSDESAPDKPAPDEPAPGEPEPDEVSTPDTSAAPTLETKIDSLVDAIAQLVQLQAQALTVPRSTGAIAPMVDRQAPGREAVRRRQEMASQPVVAQSGQMERKYRPRGTNETLINQAISAIMRHNDQARTHDQKWAISINSLKGFEGISSQHAISKALENRQEEIEAHHQKHQIDSAKHNLRHRGKAKIGEIIRLS